MNLADLTNPATNPLPEEVQDLVATLLEGRVHSLMIVAEFTVSEGNQGWIRGFSLDMDDNESDAYGFLGHINMMTRQIQDDIETPQLSITIKGDDDDTDDD